MALRKRTWKLIVGTHDLTELDFAFAVRKTSKPEPNTCDIAVIGCADDTRHEFATAKSLPVKLEAGYNGDNALLYLGEVRSGISFREGDADWTTKLETGDSEAQHRAHISIPVGAKTDAATVLRAIARTMGVGEGNVNTAAALLKARGLTLHGAATVISDTAATVLTDFCRSAGLEWSIQDGRLQVLDLNKALEQQAVLLSAEHGMVGSPKVDHKGVLEVTALLQPDLACGRKVYMRSQEIQGLFRITDVEYKGNTAGQEWYATIRGKRLKY